MHKVASWLCNMCNGAVPDGYTRTRSRARTGKWLEVYDHEFWSETRDKSKKVRCRVRCGIRCRIYDREQEVQGRYKRYKRSDYRKKNRRAHRGSAIYPSDSSIPHAVTAPRTHNRYQS